jgi:hypothetical protein
MLIKKSEYISILDGAETRSISGDIEVIPQTRVVQLGGENWGWVWNQPRGLIVRRAGSEEQIRIMNPTRVITFLLYGLSAVLVMLGMLKTFERRSEK